MERRTIATDWNDLSTWEALVSLFRDGLQYVDVYKVPRIFEAIFRPIKNDSVRIVAALALSAAKWSPEFRKEYDLNGYRADLATFEIWSDNCALCWLMGMCNPCPLGGCGWSSLWDAVSNSICARDGKFHKHADALYNRLVELYEEHYEALSEKEKAMGVFRREDFMKAFE